MISSINLKGKSNTIALRYQRIREQLESTYGKMHGRVASRLHESNNKTEKVRQSFNKPIEEASLKGNDKPRPNIAIVIPQVLTSRTRTNEDFLDWTRGRFNGNVVKIIVKNGIIIEKSFITNKGSLIIVNRKELGLFRRSI